MVLKTVDVPDYGSMARAIVSLMMKIVYRSTEIEEVTFKLMVRSKRKRILIRYR